MRQAFGKENLFVQQQYNVATVVFLAKKAEL
jgi:hypothetical protein